MGERRRDAVDMLVGSNIRLLRQNRKMSQTELGRRIDVTFGVKYREDIVDGLENAPASLLGVLQGKNFGKMLVRTAT